MTAVCALYLILKPYIVINIAFREWRVITVACIHSFTSLFFFRLGSNTVEPSSSEPPTDGHHPHPGETDSITATQSDVPETAMSGDEQESGLDWFYSITPSQTSNEIPSAVFTSTQLDANQKTDSSVATKAASPVNYHPSSNPDPTATVTAEEGAMIGEKHAENLHGSDKQHAEASGSAIQLRRKLQQRKNEVTVKNASQAASVSDATSDTNVDHRIQSKPRFHPATKTTSAPLPDTIAASDENIPFKFSDFVFKPKKMTSFVGSVDSGAGAPECNLDSRNGPNVQQKLGGNHEAQGALPGNDGRKNKTREKHPRFKGGSVKKQVSCVSNKTTLSFPPEEPEKEKPPRAQAGGAINIRPDMESQDNLRSKESLTPLRATSSPAKSTVTPSTLAKLSRFSFSGTTEPRPTLPADLEKNQHLEKSPREEECAALSRTASDRTTEQRPKRMKRMREVKAASSSPNASQHPPPLEHGPVKRASIKLTEPTPSGTHGVKMGHGRATECHNSVKMKRKCLESGTPASATCGSKGVFVKSSLFGSGDLNDDILDTDWDNEVAKKAKV